MSLTENTSDDYGPRCAYCGDRIEGGPGGWFSLVTKMETCPELAMGFHEPPE